MEDSRYKTINGVPHIRIRSGAYRRIHEIVGGLLDGAVQIKTRQKWKWLKGPRKRPRMAAKAQQPPALPNKISIVSRALEADTSDGASTENSSCLPPYWEAGSEVPSQMESLERPKGLQLVVWTDKYRVLKQCAALPQE